MKQILNLTWHDITILDKNNKEIQTILSDDIIRLEIEEKDLKTDYNLPIKNREVVWMLLNDLDLDDIQKADAVIVSAFQFEN